METPPPNSQSDELYPDENIAMVYHMLRELITVGENTIVLELQKPKEEQDAFYLMGETKLLAGLEVAVRALEESGLVDEEMEQLEVVSQENAKVLAEQEASAAGDKDVN